jgi:hypothetical protein
MNYDYYYKRMQELNKIVQQSADKKEIFWQHILLVSSTILGILIALHQTSILSPHIRLVFLLANFLLLIGILTSGIVLYDYTNLAERLRQAYHSELDTAFHEDRKVEAVFVKKKKRTLICEKIALISLAAGMISLFAYALLVYL